MYDGIYLGTRLDNFAQALELADVVLLKCPVVLIIRQRIILNRCCRQSRHNLFPLEFVKTKTKTAFCLVIKIGNVSHHTWCHLQLYVFYNRRTFLFNIRILKIHLGHVPLGNDIGTEHKSTDGYQRSGEHIRTQQTTKTHSRCFHRNNLRVICQFGCKEDNGYEYKERTEEVGEIGNEVEVVIEDNLLHTDMALRELVNTLVEVKDNGYRYDDSYQKDVGAQELDNDIPIQSFHLHLSQRMQQPLPPFPHTRNPFTFA